MMWVYAFIGLMLHGRLVSAERNVINLCGTDWNAVNANESIKINATVPGSIYTDLMRANIIGDPYYRLNDDVYRWVAHDNWTFTKTFHLENMPTQRHVDLVFYGVDTIATLFINGKMVAQMNNMFRRYVVPVKSFLTAGSNHMVLQFQSPVTYAKAQSSAYPYDVPPDCPGPESHGECHANFIRKEASSFSWDWGPSFPTVGIWKNVSLVMYDSAHISQVTTRITQDQAWPWEVFGVVYFDVKDKVNGTLNATILDGHYVPSPSSQQTCTLDVTNPYCKFYIRIIEFPVQPWWPNGHGEQKLYTLRIYWDSDNSSSEWDVYTQNLAFRTVQLVQEPIPHATGMSFYFKINDKPVYMKGSNWIPTDSFQERITPAYLRKLLTSAKDANMNMLRVWGGGVYESEVFYDLADELGILIWQDIMLACALYPTDDTFLQNVVDEVTYQVRRLQRHPSIAVWAGNNENEEALATNWYAVKPQDMPRYYADYRKLYLDTIEKVVHAEDPSRPFVSSSPSNGVDTVKEGGIAKDPQDEHWGDVHYYNYYRDAWNYSVFPTPRFASEFGFQSWCSEETLRPVSVPDDLRLNSTFTSHRQHHPDGNPQLVEEISQHLNMTNTGDATRDFQNFIYLSQINQAVSIKTEAEHYRRMQSSLTSDGRGHTMGSLYWQLNDIWQGPTWASTEYGGKWKMLHYYARNFYNPVMISPALRPDDSIHVYIVNDSLPVFHLDTALSNKNDAKFYALRFKPHNEVVDSVEFGKEYQFRNDVLEDSRLHESKRSLGYTMYSWDSLTPLKTWTVPFDKMPTVASEVVFQTDVETLLKESNCPSVHNCFLYFGLDDCSVTNWLLLSNFTTAQGLKKANVQITQVTMLNSTTLSFTMTTDTIAPFVWLELPGYQGYFSDNGFIMVEAILKLTYTAFEPFSSDIKITPTSFMVRSLMDVYET